MARKCGLCRGEGHTRATCPDAMKNQAVPVTADHTCACGEVTTMGPFPGRHEADACRVPLEETRGHSQEEPASTYADPFTSPTQTPILEEAPHPEESPVGDHRKWCTRCKLLGHYAADCTTAVLSGGVVSVPEPAPYTGPKLADPDGSLTRRAIEALNRRTPEQKAETAARMDARVSALLGLPLEEAGGECKCGRGTSNDNEVCDTCAGSAQHTSPYVAALAAEVGDPGTVGQYLSEDPPLTGFLVDKAREVDEPDPFESPTQPTEELNVSGQPKSRYEWYGKQNRGYLVKLPETGDFRRYKNGKPKGLTRATTFNKAATDQNALGDWKARNVLIGASKRPDLVAQAHGLTHEDNRDQLMKLVADLETTAGAKVSADVGTLIHELTERWDAGQLKPEDIPQAYRFLIFQYDETLKEAGLRPVPGLIERTTYIPEFGGVVGTLDRVYYHERSGQYVIGDVKTGKTLKYGMDEIETQEWIYAHGVNNAGVYDWNTDTWDRPWEGAGIGPQWSPLTSVSEEWGIVVHMPVQGDDAGKVMLVQANLQRGRRHAQVCHDVRLQRATKPKPEPWTGEELGGRETAAWEDAAEWGYWERQFSDVPSQESAGLLWDQARAAGVPLQELKRLVEIAGTRLAELKELDQPLTWVEQAERVLTKEDAADVWQRASAAGVQGPELDSLVAIMQRELS